MRAAGPGVARRISDTQASRLSGAARRRATPDLCAQAALADWMMSGAEIPCAQATLACETMSGGRVERGRRADGPNRRRLQAALA
jgi:hypothetical protein